MTKIFLKFFIALGMIATGFNQQTFAQAVEEEDIVLEGYYGFPNLYTAVFRAAYANSGSELDLTTGGAGPFGFRFEYLVTDKVGLGLDMSYTSSSVSFNDASTGTIYNYDFSTSRTGVLVCFNYHFLDNDEFDLFSTVGIGYAKRNFDFTSTEPGYQPISVESLIPVGVKAGLGMRYFFTDNIGANLQFAFGPGGLINAGLSFKL
jgi:opacity protein-like surface antigen